MWINLTKKAGGADTSKKIEKPAGSDFDAEDPSSSLMKMMQNLYETGDDDMKRTISESFAKARAG